MTTHDRILKLTIFLLMPAFIIFNFGVIIRGANAQVYTFDSDTTDVTAEIDDDRDGDGMPDTWEINHGFDFTDPADAEFDPDFDDLKNLLEYLNGTDPLDPDTDDGSIKDGEEVARGTDPLDPRDDRKEDFGAKRAVASPRLDKRADRDGDGLSDIQEDKFFTNKDKKDTDEDGIGDYDEIFTYFTDPLNWDTDGDKLKDGEEVFIYATNPKEDDTDKDLIIDGDEVIYYRTSPTLADTDAGGVNDGDEVFFNNTNPLNGTDDFGKLSEDDDFSPPKIKIFLNDIALEEYETLDRTKTLSKYNETLLTNTKFRIKLESKNTTKIDSYTIIFNEKKYVIENIEEIAELTTPENPGLYEIRIELNIDNQVVYMTKMIDVVQRGRLFGRVEGVFGKFFRKINIGEYGVLNNSEIKLYKYVQSTGAWTLYKPSNFNVINPYESDDGRYAFLVEPGIYKIELQKGISQPLERYYAFEKYGILSEDLYLTYNYDKYAWAMLFILIYNIIGGIHLIAKNSKLLAKNHIKHAH